MADLKLKTIQKEAREKSFRPSDFLSNEQMQEVHKSNAKGKKSSYSVVDAYIAEILARFGYETYVAWKFGEIGSEQMTKYIKAERVRETQNRLASENILVAAIAGANRPKKGGSVPESLKVAIKMLKQEEKNAKGGE